MFPKQKGEDVRKVPWSSGSDTPVPTAAAQNDGLGDVNGGSGKLLAERFGAGNSAVIG
jgi:hypothetical protein